MEKIECTQNGAIVFACTSVETPRIPRMSGRTRVNTKVQKKAHLYKKKHKGILIHVFSYKVGF